MGEVVRCLLAASNLRVLEVTPRNTSLSSEHMHALGMLPLRELRLNSYTYSQQPAINRSSQSHLDNDGVRALVDSICHRINARPGMPLHLPACPRPRPCPGKPSFKPSHDTADFAPLLTNL